MFINMPDKISQELAALKQPDEEVIFIASILPVSTERDVRYRIRIVDEEKNEAARFIGRARAYQRDDVKFGEILASKPVKLWNLTGALEIIFDYNSGDGWYQATPDDFTSVEANAFQMFLVQFSDTGRVSGNVGYMFSAR